MSLRLLVGSLLLGSFALMRGFIPDSAPQTPEKQTVAPRWEYKALKLEANQCSYENQVAASLNAVGEDGWELISYERLSITFPKDAEGTLLISLRPPAQAVNIRHKPPTHFKEP
jgi:hypothetical protein